MTSAFRCAFLFTCITAMLSTAVSQNMPSAAPTVEVRLQMNWWTDQSARYPRVAVVRLDPLDGKGGAQILRVSESSTSIARLAPGRYQLTTTSPLTFERQAYGWSIELPLVSAVNYVKLSTENAVRLAPGEVVEAVVADASGLRTVVVSNARENEADARRQITKLLRVWITSLKSRSISAQMSCYAPRVAYLEQVNLSREQLEMRKRKQLNSYTRIQRLDLDDVDMEMTASKALASAVKSWVFSNDEAEWRGHVLVNFEFAKVDGRWVITSEQERPVPVPSLRAPSAVAVSRASVDR
jgi:hypothetical protein